MKICGFTIVRNIVRYDYPAVEAIQSILPVCDKVIVCVGKSEDNTRQVIESMNNPKIQIVDSVWDDSLRQGGAVLAVETNKAFDAIPDGYDWAFYIQADEVIHEKYHGEILRTMAEHMDNKEVEGLLFNYLHFWGNYKYIGDSRRWYRKEIRIIRNNKTIRSYRDAQGFRINSRKLNVKQIDACVNHYGWVKNPYKLKDKEKNFNKLWFSDEKLKRLIKDELLYDLYTIDSLSLFEESHPAVMRDRIKRLDWDFEYDVRKKNLKFKDMVLHFIERVTGKRLFEYRNYTVI